MGDLTERSEVVKLTKNPTPRTRLALRCGASAADQPCMRHWLSLALLLAALGGCGDAPTPEQEVRAALGALEAAAESGDVAAFAELVSAAYTDPYGHDREKLRAFVAFHVMQSGRGREVIVRVRDVNFTDPARAVVTLAVGLAGARGARGLGAEVYAVDIDLVREEDDAWRVTFAQWRPAPAAELL
jgi:hypothetical protein